MLLLSLAILSVSLGCVSAENIDDANSTIVSIDDSQINEIKDISFDDNNLESSENDKLEAAGDYVQIKDHRTGQTGTIATTDSSVSLDMTWSGAGGTNLYLYVDGVETSNTYSISLFENSGSADSAFTYSFDKPGTYVLKVDTGSHIYESNHLTYIYQSGGSQPDNGTTSENESATITIYDMAYPAQSTIVSNGDYVSDIAYNIVKSGDGYTDESLEVFVNGQSVGSTTPNQSNRLGNLTFTKDNEWILTVVYTATVNGKTITATSNNLTFITRNTSGENETESENGTATITIWDMNSPAQSTITSDGDYTASIAYNIVKSGDGFSDESLEVFVNGVSVGSTTPNSANQLGDLKIDEDNTWIVTIVYTATFDGKTVTATSNALTFITRNTSGGNSSTNGTGNNTNGSGENPNPQPGEFQVIIRDANNPNKAIINLDDKYNVQLEYYVTVPEGSLVVNDLIIMCNGQAITTINPVDKTYTSIGGTIFINETGDYVFTAKYSYWVFMTEIRGTIESNSITYHATIANDTETDEPTLSITVESVLYTNPSTVTVKSNIDGVYIVSVGDESKEVTVSGGVGTTTFTLPEGDYTANVVSKTNSSLMNSTSFSVYPKGKETPVVRSNVDVLEDKVKITLNFPADINDEKVTVNLNGNTAKEVTISNGVATVEFDGLTAGDYSYTILYDGNEKYSKVNNVRTFTITNSSSQGNSSDNSSGSDTNQSGDSGSSIVAADMIRGAGSPYDFKAAFYDDKGNPLADSEVNFIVNGNDNVVKTDEYGVAKLVNVLSVGDYVITIRNYATGEITTRNVTIVARISGNKNVNVDYSYSANYKVRVFADNGQAVGAGERVSITLNNVKRTVITDKNGYATFKVSGLLPKTYTITAEYKGVKVSNKVVVKQILKAKNTKFKKAKKVKKYKVTLKTSAGKAIKGKKITLKVKGKTYKAKTNSKGVAKFKIKNLKKVGKYKATIKYLKTSIKKTIKVKK